MRNITAAVTLTVFTVGCGAKPPPAPAPTAVIAAPAGKAADTRPQTLHYPVEVSSRYSNTLSFRVAGKIVERKVRLGDRVHRGEVVARLDAADADKQAASAAAALTGAEHRLEYARQQLARDEAQSKRDLIAANQLEQSQDSYAAALAGRDQAAAQQTLARNTLAYQTLTADHDGLITSENADTGQVVSAGQAIYALAWSGDTDAVLDVAASDIGQLRINQAASVTFPALPGQRFESQVREISPAADPQSRTFHVKLTLTAPSEQVRFGMTGEAEIAVAGARAGLAPAATAVAAPAATPVSVVLPSTALFHQDARAAVWVVKPGDSTLELRPVTVASYGSRTVTVTDGIKPDETVVLAGVHTVHAGQRVKPIAPLFASEAADADPAR